MTTRQRIISIMKSAIKLPEIERGEILDKIADLGYSELISEAHKGLKNEM